MALDNTDLIIVGVAIVAIAGIYFISNTQVMPLATPTSTQLSVSPTQSAVTPQTNPPVSVAATVAQPIVALTPSVLNAVPSSSSTSSDIAGSVETTTTSPLVTTGTQTAVPVIVVPSAATAGAPAILNTTYPAPVGQTIQAMSIQYYTSAQNAGNGASITVSISGSGYTPGGYAKANVYTAGQSGAQGSIVTTASSTGTISGSMVLGVSGSSGSFALIGTDVTNSTSVTTSFNWTS